jgi:hypothetical protein
LFGREPKALTVGCDRALAVRSHELFDLICRGSGFEAIEHVLVLVAEAGRDAASIPNHRCAHRGNSLLTPIEHLP